MYSENTAGFRPTIHATTPEAPEAPSASPTSRQSPESFHIFIHLQAQ